MRLDLFLKTSRLVKRRTTARELCEAGRILVNGHDAKPSKEIRPGDRIVLLYSTKRVELEVIMMPDMRGKYGSDSLYRVLAETRTPKGTQAWNDHPSSS